MHTSKECPPKTCSPFREFRKSTTEIFYINCFLCIDAVLERVKIHIPTAAKSSPHTKILRELGVRDLCLEITAANHPRRMLRRRELEPCEQFVMECAPVPALGGN